MPKKTPLDRVREICLALPEATERLSHGAAMFFVADKKTFVMFHDNHHGDGILGLWCAASPGVQAELLSEEPDRFYRPAYVGHRGRIGVRLDRKPDWAEVAEIVEDAYRTVAGPRHVKLLDVRVAPERRRLNAAALAVRVSSAGRPGSG